MADQGAEIKSTAEALKGKKAKVKPLKTEPTGTQGKKLDGKVKKALEEHFSKAKLNKVQVHTGGNAKDVAKELKAKAFTIGSDIYFAKPADAKNPKMIAHEMAHVIQQGNGKLPKSQKGKALTSK